MHSILGMSDVMLCRRTELLIDERDVPFAAALYVRISLEAGRTIATIPHKYVPMGYV